jgi:hypothetical protein
MDTRPAKNCSCSCGKNVQHEDAHHHDPHTVASNTIRESRPLDSSFVHLPLPPQHGKDLNGINFGTDQLSDEGDLYNQGILNSYRHINTLLQVAEDHLSARSGEDIEMDAHMCLNCVERIASAIEDNTARLEAESDDYDAAVKYEQGKRRRLLKALSISAEINQEKGKEDDEHVEFSETWQEENILQNALDTLDDELKRLQIIHEEHKSELQKMDGLLEVQVRIAQTLTEQEDEVLTEFNSLGVDARVFQDIHRHLTYQCHAAEREKFHLSRLQLHSALFRIDVDERGLRYPLINNLRLTHRPKGISWLEINAAWSQSAQLLMFVGSTIKFKSKDLRIVPLMSCAKIIEVGSNGETRLVHHLGVDFQTSSSEDIIPSVKAFHNLLHQMSVHMLNSKEVDSLDPAPFEVRHSIIGSHDLRHIDARDDVGWSTVIHCIASYMKWMSRNACKFIR